MSGLLVLLIRGGPVLVFGCAAITILLMVLAAFDFLASLAVGFTDAASAADYTKAGWGCISNAIDGLLIIVIVGAFYFRQFGKIADFFGKHINPRHEELDLEDNSNLAFGIAFLLGVGWAIAYFTGHQTVKANLLGLIMICLVVGGIMLALDMIAQKSSKYPRWVPLGAAKATDHDHETLD